MMRGLFRATVVFLLRLEARVVLRKYRPRVVAVTGSVGKTTTKNLLTAMLQSRFRLHQGQGGYNTEFGVPLAILDQRAARSIGGWLRVLRHGVSLSLRKVDYPEVVVLEMGADRPGDIRYLTRIARPELSVVTNVGTAHLMNYDSPEGIAEEKSWLVRALSSEGQAVLNFDDTKVRMMQACAPGRVIYFGFTDEANVWPTDVTAGPDGLAATINLRLNEGTSVQSWPLRTQLLGRNQLSAILAGFAAATAFGVAPEQALQAAADFTSPPGRLRVFNGKSNLTILDDSYNSSPKAALNSLEVLRTFPGPHRAILGDMSELGKGSAAGHRMVGVAAAELDQLVVVGDEAAQIAYAAREAGMDEEKIQIAHEAGEAAGLINQEGEGGTVLIKGSQVMYLERAVGALLADPQDRSRLVQRLRDPAHRRNLSQANKRRQKTRFR